MASLYSRYKVQSSDVLQDARTNVIDETSEKVVWYKERFLGDDEIIEHLVHSPTQSIHWIIHRPSQKGWYIRIRSPSFPPGVYIPLAPIAKRGKDAKGAVWDEGAVVDGSLGFRTRVVDGKPNSNADATNLTPPVHSYPPTPPPAPTVSLTPASPPTSPSLDRPISTLASSSSMTLLAQSTETLSLPPVSSSTSTSKSTIAEFILSPTTNTTTTTTSSSSARPSRDGLFSRALSAFKYYTASTDIISNGYSFTLSRVIVQSPPPYVAFAATPGSILPTTMSPSLSGGGGAPASEPSSSPSGLPSASERATSTSGSGTPSSTKPTIPTLTPNSQKPSSPSSLRKLRSPIPLLTFTDLTPAFNISGSISGSLVVDTREAEHLGVEESFWVAVGLVYVGFLEERGSYLARLGD